MAGREPRPPQAARGQEGRGGCARHGDYARSAALFEEGLVLRGELGGRRGIAPALDNPGVVARARGDLAGAASLCEESPGMLRALEDGSGVAMVLSNRGEVAEDGGDHAEAGALDEESLDLYREIGEKTSIALLTSRLGRTTAPRDDHRAALFEEGLLLHSEPGDRLGIAQDLEGVAAMRASQDRPGSAARLYAAAERLRGEIGAPQKAAERARHEPLVATARAALGDVAFAEAWVEGRRLTPEQVMDAW